jgi:hypothetical protein
VAGPRTVEAAAAAERSSRSGSRRIAEHSGVMFEEVGFGLGWLAASQLRGFVGLWLVQDYPFRSIFEDSYIPLYYYISKLLSLLFFLIYIWLFILFIIFKKISYILLLFFINKENSNTTYNLTYLNKTIG